MPGITVTGYRERNIQRATTEVVSVLSDRRTSPAPAKATSPARYRASRA